MKKVLLSVLFLIFAVPSFALASVDLTISRPSFQTNTRGEASLGFYHSNKGPDTATAFIPMGMKWLDASGNLVGTEGTFRFGMYYDVGTSGTEKFLSTVDASLDGTTKRNFQLFLTNVPEGAKTLRVTIDPDNTLNDSDITNNVVELPRWPMTLAISGEPTFYGDLLELYIGNIGTSYIKGRVPVTFQWQDNAGTAIGPNTVYVIDQLFSPVQSFFISSRGRYNESARTGRGGFEALDRYVKNMPAGATQMKISFLETNKVITAKLVDFMPTEAGLLTTTQLIVPIKNAGTGSTFSPLSLDFVWLDKDGNALGMVRRFQYVPTLQQGMFTPNGSYVINSQTLRNYEVFLDSSGNVLTGAVQLRVTMDPDNAIRESNETNNVLLIPRPLPDPTIDTAEFLADGSLHFVFKNLGLKDYYSSYSKDIFEWLDASGSRIGNVYEYQPLTDYTLRNKNTGYDLDKHEATFSVSSNVRNIPQALKDFVTVPPAGATQFKITLDSDNTVVESNENNNTITIPHTAVTAPATSGNTSSSRPASLETADTTTGPGNPSAQGTASSGGKAGGTASTNKLKQVLPIKCSSKYVPVCGKDGKTYTNECFAKQKGTAVAYAGKCAVVKKPVPVKTPAPAIPRKQGASIFDAIRNFFKR